MAVSTCEPCVGWIVPFVRAGVGAIASQARSNPYFGIDGLDLLAEGQGAGGRWRRCWPETPWKTGNSAS